MSDAEESESGEEGKQTKFQKKQVELQKQIRELENEAIEPKAWTLSGEVAASDRPVNSLLDEDLEFEHAYRPAPVITVERTETLEDVIKRRIAECSWDDVARKREVVEKSKTLEDVSNEKSKVGLGEIYEQDHVRQANNLPEPKNEALKKQYEEIDVLFKKICSGLDALSNYYFTPKPVSLFVFQAKVSHLIVPFRFSPRQKHRLLLTCRP